VVTTPPAALLFVSSTDQGGGNDEGHSLTKSPQTINHSADNDCTNEPPDKYAEQWLLSMPNNGFPVAFA
jgi:hypothetical protein